MINRKCRAEYVKTLWISGDRQEAEGQHNSATIYRIGEITRPNSYDGDPRVDCTNGIHFWLTKEEALDW